MANFTWLALHFHMVFMLTTFLGIILFMVWAIRDLKRKKLFKLFIWMLIIGVVGSLLTAVFWAGPMGEFMNRNNAEGSPEFMMNDGMMNGVNWSFTY